ncbi:hypothetical protein [Rhodococcus sovatensis]|uniref:Uncharacterized protein n=1 Tax=Rhodococcus sovatensis TaxID=1805840 RepID=A0ABZ2PY55_9NOCA
MRVGAEGPDRWWAGRMDRIGADYRDSIAAAGRRYEEAVRSTLAPKQDSSAPDVPTDEAEREPLSYLIPANLDTRARRGSAAEAPHDPAPTTWLV